MRSEDHAGPAPRCGLCGSSGIPWCTKRGFDIMRCTRCYNAFLPSEQTPDDLEQLYSKGYFEGTEATGYPTYLGDAALLAKNFAQRARWIASLKPPGNRLLEVGCAYGFFLNAARDCGFEPTGVEISKECVNSATRTCDSEIIQGDFMTAVLRGPFDVVAMFDVIEHMRDPGAVLRRARELLAPNGLLVVETGDFATPWARALGCRWYFVDPPQHLFYFSARGLERLTRRCGFTGPSFLRRMGRRVSFSNIGFKLSSALPDGAVRRRFVAATKRRVPGFLYLNFGDGMLFAVRR